MLQLENLVALAASSDSNPDKTSRNQIQIEKRVKPVMNRKSTTAQVLNKV
jgi:hypothetical protein